MLDMGVSRKKARSHESMLALLFPGGAAFYRACSSPSNVPAAVPARAGVPLATVFFDPEGRLERGRGPSGELASTRYVPVHSGDLLVRPAEDGMFEPEFLSESQAAPFLADENCISAWLGECNDGALAKDSDGTVGYRLLELSHLTEPPDAAALGVKTGAQWAPLRASRGPGGDAPAILASKVHVSDDDYAALFATARGLALWHRSVNFCAVCGGETRPFRDGANQKCVDCGTRFRPRTGDSQQKAPAALAPVSVAGHD